MFLLALVTAVSLVGSIVILVQYARAGDIKNAILCFVFAVIPFIAAEYFALNSIF